MKNNRLNTFSKVILCLCALLAAGSVASLFLVDDDAAISRISFQLFETVVMMVLIFVPSMLSRFAHIRVPHSMEVIFVAFGFSSLILGDVIDFYGRFPWWDAMLHTASGVLLGIIGYAIINLFNRIEGHTIRFPALFVSIWVVCFALSIGAAWEIMEYLTDGWFGLNSQQYLVSSGTFDDSIPLVGHEALRDTMEDLMLDFCGSIAIAVVGFIDTMKKKRK